jgi:hypothetical protein
VEREKAAIGVFITLELPTSAMRTEAASAGFYVASELEGKKYPRIQILTIVDLLSGRKIDYPMAVMVANITFKGSPKSEARKKAQGLLQQTTLPKD